MKRFRVLVAMACGVLLLAAGCGGDNKVGDKSLLNFKDQAQQRLGATTTTVPPTTVAGAKGQLGLGATTAPPNKVATTQPPATQPAQQTFDIEINSDGTSSTQFDPAAARVFKGTVIKWVNKDTVPRSVEADNGAFKSPAIPPGGAFTYPANAVGQFNYHDGTRPYAVGAFEVINR